jgi:hypothetical protein
MSPEEAMCAASTNSPNYVLTFSSFVQKCVQVASVVLVYYDHTLTFPDEVRVVWSRISWKGTWLFLLNRYLTFVTYIIVAVYSWTPFSETSCALFLVSREGVFVVSTAVVTCECSVRGRR